MFKSFADLLTYQLLLLPPGTQMAESINFFLYDLPKIYSLLLTIVFVVAIIRTFLPPERIRDILSHEREFLGNITAAALGIFIPFCTCSAIPLFIGMLESGVPLGVTMSFLVSSPMINEIALVLLWGLFGWKVAVTYVFSGMIIAVFSGVLISKLKMDDQVEDFVRQAKTAGWQQEHKLSWQERISYAYEYTLDIFRQVWIYVMAGVGVGALIHGYVPVDFVTKYAGGSHPFTVIVAVLIGIPIYANCAGAIPVVQAILEKGLPLGTSLAFLMSVSGLSLPEFIILRKVLKPKLLLTFFSTVAVGIILVGYLFNLIFSGSPALAAAKVKTQAITTLDEALKTKLPIVVKLGADWCRPCREMKPIIKELAVELEGKVVFLDLAVEKNEGLVKKFKVNLIPTVIFYDTKGKPKEVVVGFMSKEAILKKVKELGPIK